MSNILCGDKSLDLTQPIVMGILNVTPDSFSDGGQFNALDTALLKVEQMIIDGAKIIDIGGESTRPGAAIVSVEQEIERVLPVLSAIKSRFDVVISIDTSKAQVITEAANAGAGIINDVRSLQAEGALISAAATQLPICLMHMQGQPQSMQNNPEYSDVVSDIYSFFELQISRCVSAGIEKSRLLLDPGFGFGKTLSQNYQILANLEKFNAFNLPLLAGLSRKSMIGNLLHRDIEQRLAGSLSAAVIAVINGAKIIRVHDVKETVDAVKVVMATLQEKN